MRYLRTLFRPFDCKFERDAMLGAFALFGMMAGQVLAAALAGRL